MVKKVCALHRKPFLKHPLLTTFLLFLTVNEVFLINQLKKYFYTRHLKLFVPFKRKLLSPSQKLLETPTFYHILISFHGKWRVNFFCQYTKFRNAAYEKVHLDLVQNFFKIKLKVHNQLSKKCLDKFCSPFFCAILSSRKNVSNMLCLIMKILTEKNPLYHSLPSLLGALFYLDYHPRPHKVREV